MYKQSGDKKIKDGANAVPSGHGPDGFKRLNTDIQATLHARFKAVCARRGEQMTEVIRRLIESWIDKHE